MKTASIHPAPHDSLKQKERAPCCESCKALAPRTNTNFTLISSQHGWRLTFEHENGRRVPIWRCPKCWQAYKAKTSGASDPAPASTTQTRRRTEGTGLVARLLSRRPGSAATG